MNINNFGVIKSLITGLESSQIEFKETTGQLERGMETICAFLNGEGGTVLFGVTDKGKVIGQDIADNTKRNIAEAINRLEPLAEVQLSYVAIPGSDKKVIALHVEDSRFERPFTYKGRPYYRVESMTTTMPQSIYNEFLMFRDGSKYRWELFENGDISLQDIDDNEVLKTVRLGIECGRLPENIGNNIPMILEKFGLIRNGKLNHAAAILFANKELVEYPQCLLRLARFRGTDKMEFLDNQRIQGNIFKLLDAAMAFIFKHLSLSGKIEGLEREEQLTIPYKAVREGIINSLCHRQYRTIRGSVGIAIYDDRVEIENPGVFPPAWDLEKMKSEHRSEPQNPLIANVLYKRKLLESWGRGIILMIEECKKANLQEPEYKSEDGFIVLTFRYEPVAGQVTGQVTGQVMGQVTGQVRMLVSCLDRQELSVKEIMEVLSLKGRDNFLNGYLNPAMKDGFVEQTHPENSRHRNQKYRLTEKGRLLLSSISNISM